MITNEQILKGAVTRWKQNTNTECLILEARYLLNEIEIYRDCLASMRKVIDGTICTLQDRGGE